MLCLYFVNSDLNTSQQFVKQSVLREHKVYVLQSLLSIVFEFK